MKRFFKNMAFGFTAYSVFLFCFILYGVQSLPDEFALAAGGRAELPLFYHLTVENGADAQASAGEGAYYTYPARVDALGIVPVKQVNVTVSRRQYVHLGGDIIGVKMYTDGVITVSVDEVNTLSGSVSPAKDAGLRVGDIITQINGKTMESSEDLAQTVETSEGKALDLHILRGTGEYDMKLIPVQSAEGVYRAGIWVRDSSAGVGTVTFTQPESGVFAALGHAVCDVDTGEKMPLANGSAVEAGIKGIYQGTKNGPGELCGVFTGLSVGNITANTSTGIYGIFTDESYLEGESIPVALADEVKTGKAQIVATVDGEGPKWYTVEITKLYSAADTANRNMVITVTDPALLKKTGGIVQGMSGSPIVQDGMLAGAVTHVFVNDPAKGYAIYAENMLRSAI